MTLAEYRVAIAAAIGSRNLTASEGHALITVFDRIHRAGTTPEIEAACRRNLAELGAATTVARAARVAEWTYVDPDSLRRAAKRCSA